MFRKVVLFAAAGVFAAVVGLAGITETQASGQAGCIDGSKSGNIKYKWSGNDKITVSTKSSQAVCKDTTLFFSGFTMPDTWDGKGWNRTAVPQVHHASVSRTFKAGKSNQQFVMELNLDKCKNMQVDLYYSPQQDKVTWDYKIGERLITAKHVKATICEPPVNKIEVCDITGGGLVTIEEGAFKPGDHSKDLSDCDPVTPDEPEAPEDPEAPTGEGAIADSEVPAELPRTGGVANLLTVLLAAFGTYSAVYRLRR